MNDEDKEALRRLAEAIAKDPCIITKVGIDGVAVQSSIKHSYSWKWVDGQMTDTLVCSTCNKEKDIVYDGKVGAPVGTGPQPTAVDRA